MDMESAAVLGEIKLCFINLRYLLDHLQYVTKVIFYTSITYFGAIIKYCEFQTRHILTCLVYLSNGNINWI